ncbi:MAG TPA: hypothetical protein VF573_15620, partial [Paraburkholderia sp.]
PGTPASGTAVATTKGGHAASAAQPASAAVADKGASETATMASATGASQPATGTPTATLPPLPAPEPPMTQYWAAYGACMQARGYVVAQ